MAILGAVLAFTVSGISGLALILETLYRLFLEGRIGKALYKRVLKALSRKWGWQNVTIDQLLD